MSKHYNYNNYSKPANNKVEKTEPEVRTENLEDEIPISETDTEVSETKEESEVVLAEVVFSGKVVNCSLLNVREQASVDANVVCKINKDDEVVINKDKSTSDFYKVCTATGIEGYCMKEFIRIR